MTVKDTLVRTREILVERGVNRDGWFIDQDACKVCIMGGVFLASGGKIEVDEYEDYEWSVDKQAEVPVTVKEVRIEGYDLKQADLATELIRAVVPENARFHPFDGPSIVVFNDRSTSDDEVLAVLDRAIANAE